MQIGQRSGAAGLKGGARVARGKLNVVAKQYSGPPPAWPRRVVVPEVQPRDGPKVRGLLLGWGGSGFAERERGRES